MRKIYKGQTNRGTDLPESGRIEGPLLLDEEILGSILRVGDSFTTSWIIIEILLVIALIIIIR